MVVDAKSSSGEPRPTEREEGGTQHHALTGASRSPNCKVGSAASKAHRDMTHIPSKDSPTSHPPLSTQEKIPSTFPVVESVQHSTELTLSGNSRNSRFLLPSSPRFISSTPLCFVSPSQPWNNLSHVVEHPGWVEFCVGVNSV
ncbi:hypothetical protein NQZ68_003503 [Dissostichus eleginoides]|nr:hypothetical protein NQZ68_003503 [Dissostichus eleginoides]